MGPRGGARAPELDSMPSSDRPGCCRNNRSSSVDRERPAAGTSGPQSRRRRRDHWSATSRPGRNRRGCRFPKGNAPCSCERAFGDDVGGDRSHGGCGRSRRLPAGIAATNAAASSMLAPVQHPFQSVAEDQVEFGPPAPHPLKLLLGSVAVVPAPQAAWSTPTACRPCRASPPPPADRSRAHR